jgi:putative FmdB family regulatory protein
MPTYEYKCKECDHQLEVVQSFTDDPLTKCPNCRKKALRKVFSPPGVTFKGSGKTSSSSSSSSSSDGSGSSSDSSSKASDSSSSSSTSDSKSSSSSGSSEKAAAKK